MHEKPRILVLDIETKPANGYFWGLFDQNIGLNQLRDPGGTLCVGLKWRGHPKMFMFSEWEHGRTEMIRAVHGMISEADAVVTYNGDRFDLPKLQGEFLLAGLPPPPPPTSIDVYKAAKKLGFLSNKLAYIGPLLTNDEKIKHEGFGLWMGVIDGCPKAQRKMARYCAQDVRLLEKVYDKILPYIANHPHMAAVGRNACGACGSRRTQCRGHRRTRASVIQRLQCLNCGSWFTGKRERAA